MPGKDERLNFPFEEEKKDLKTRRKVFKLKKKGEILGIILLLIMGIALISFPVTPPQLFVFLNGNSWRIGSAIIGIFFITAGVLNIFRQKK